ncbi:MAG: hypothetical protein Q8K32_32145 [Archangium sp.]|nr:hypothetical protein [Archangium sp.]
MLTILEAIEPMMTDALGLAAARSVFRTLPSAVHQPTGSLDVVEVRDVMLHLETSGRLFATPSRPFPAELLRDVVTRGSAAKPSERRFTVSSDHDVLVVQRATQALCRGFFDTTGCARLATASSELARNISMYAKQGTLTLRLSDENTHWRFDVSAVDEGPGIHNLAEILRGEYRSRTGLGRGIIGTRALLDELNIDTAPGKGTRITGHRTLRKGPS